ncbi:MAG: thioredoxin [Thermoplasmata archaeon]
MGESRELLLVTDDTFELEVLRSQIPVVVDFYADWCAPCRAAEPVLAQISRNLVGKVKFAKVNVDESGTVAQSYGITSIPTYLFVAGGREQGRELGLVAPTEFRSVLRRYFDFV